MNILRIDSKLRSENISKQIAVSFGLKFIGIALGLLVIPATLNFLGKEQYGIWVTILSIVSWMVSLDIGIGNGLRNKLAAALAVGDYELSCRYISTGYFSLSVIGIIFSIGAYIAIPFISWTSVFNTNSISDNELNNTMFVIIIPILLNFVLNVINQILNAFQRSSLTNLVIILQNGLFLIALFFFDINSSLVKVAMLYSLSLLGGSILVSIVFYLKHPSYIPKRKWIDKTKIEEILKLGGGFFIIQIATLFMFSISSILIIQLLSPEDVAIYNVTFRLFSTITIIFTIILSPFWSAFTEAHKKLDFLWIKSALNKLKHTLVLMIVIAGLLVLFHQPILNAWVGPNKVIPGEVLATLMAVYGLLLNWSNIFSYYLNGIGKIKAQTVIAVCQAISIIPLTLFFTKVLHLGLHGIMISMIVCMLPFAVLGPMITKRTLQRI